MKDLIYIGKIDYTNDLPMYFSYDKGNLVSKYDCGLTIDCDACHVKRFRNKYYVFSKNGKIVYVGSSCVKEYFGIDVDIYEKEAEALEKEERTYRANYINIDKLINTLSVQHKDFTKPYNKETSFIEFDKFLINDIMVKNIDTLKQQVYSYWEGQTSEFAYNIKAALFDDIKECLISDVKLRNLKLAMCGICFALTKKVVLSESSKWVGEISKRSIFSIVVKDIKIYDNAFGDVAYISCEDNDNNAILIKTSTSTGFYNKAIKNKSMNIKATVAKHEIKKGIRVTILQRCKMI